MSESLPSSLEPENPKPATGPAERYPTEEELREFEALREYERVMGSNVVPYTIEELARDPEHPTEHEIKAVDELNRHEEPHLTSFEEYFGHPDPREEPSAPQDDQRSPESKGE